MAVLPFTACIFMALHCARAEPPHEPTSVDETRAFELDRSKRLDFLSADRSIKRVEIKHFTTGNTFVCQDKEKLDDLADALSNALCFTSDQGWGVSSLPVYTMTIFIENEDPYLLGLHPRGISFDHVALSSRNAIYSELLARWINERLEEKTGDGISYNLYVGISRPQVKDDQD